METVTMMDLIRFLWKRRGLRSLIGQVKNLLVINFQMGNWKLACAAGHSSGRINGRNLEGGKYGRNQAR